MTAREAFTILGHTNMIRALKMMRWTNTPEEEARLGAAEWVKRHRKEYAAYGTAERDRRLTIRR